jgi:hypothetical protein
VRFEQQFGRHGKARAIDVPEIQVGREQLPEVVLQQWVSSVTWKDG